MSLELLIYRFPATSISLTSSSSSLSLAIERVLPFSFGYSDFFFLGRLGIVKLLSSSVNFSSPSTYPSLASSYAVQRLSSLFLDSASFLFLRGVDLSFSEPCFSELSFW